MYNISVYIILLFVLSIFCSNSKEFERKEFLENLNESLKEIKAIEEIQEIQEFEEKEEKENEQRRKLNNFNKVGRPMFFWSSL